MAHNDKSTEDPLDEAREEMAEKVSVAGWKESLQERVIWIRRIFQIALFAFSICSLYYCYQVAQVWRLHTGWTDEIEEVADIEFLPFSNVTICAQFYLNKTFVRENITIPEKVLLEYIKNTGGSIDTLYDNLTLFMIQTVRPKKLDLALGFYFPKILRQNPQLNDLSAFAAAAAPQCESMLKRCWFGGQEFNCCNRAVRVYDDDGICFLIALNYDSDNAEPSNLTLSQMEPGPNGGLTVEASMSLKDTPWLDDVADNGFRIYVSAAPFGDVLSPLGAPHEAETFVKVTPTKRQLSANCAPHSHLSVAENFMYYDPEGFSCLYKAMNDMVYKYSRCHIQMPLYRPNSSISCSPILVQWSAYFLIQDLELPKENVSLNKFTKSLKSWKDELLIEVDKVYKSAMSVKSKCPNHCRYWTYSTSASFFYLEKQEENESKNQDVMFSKIHVYYGDFGYRQYSQVDEPTVYLAFCDIANVIGLYWGMSIVSFVHVLFYVSRYLYFLRKSHVERKKEKPLKRAGAIKVFRSTRVAPAPQIVVTEC